MEIRDPEFNKEAIQVSNASANFCHLSAGHYKYQGWESKLYLAPAGGDDDLGPSSYWGWGCQKVPYWTDPIFVKEPLKKFHGHQADIHNSYMTGTSWGIHEQSTRILANKQKLFQWDFLKRAFLISI